MIESRITYLFHRYFDNTASPEETQELLDLINADKNSEDIQLLMQEAWETFSSEQNVFSKEKSEAILSQALRSDRKEVAPTRKLIYNWTRIAAAAVLILVTGGAFWFYSYQNHPDKKKFSSNIKSRSQDLLPGGNKALLTLADGSQLVLDESNTGKLATQGNTEILKFEDGRLDYSYSDKAGVQAAPLYNTLSTPRGGQYQVVLPDGTRVWLNAASSLRYPASFTGKKRIVYLDGEAYFEVAKNAAKPFHVEVRGLDVEVLGTHFNINAYHDESYAKTTLLEGAVKVKRGDVQKLLTPGQQAVSGGSGPLKVIAADSDEVLAWKNGYFYFNKSTLPEIMRQLSRWYDVDIRYEGTIPDRIFGGEISRSSNASEVLKILELSKVHFRIEGKYIIVMP
ncbi:MAG TPA: FecR domain-containing protein [Sphingobacteriaceae bacterium]